MVERSGFSFDGIDNGRMGISIYEKIEIGVPNKIKNKIRLTGTNIDYDYSEVNGVQQYTTRVVRIPCNFADFDRWDYRSAQLISTRVLNWLMRPNDRRVLVLNEFPDYYFMAEVVNIEEIQVNLLGIGKFDILFECYPFKIRDRNVFDDEFRTFNFLTDVRQKPEVSLPIVEDQLPFNLLSVGDLVNIGGWAQYFGSSGAVSRYHTSQSYKIEDIREVDDVDFSVFHFDKVQYFLSELNTWVRSQDVVQARNSYALDVYNGGITQVIPKVEMTPKGVTLGGLTIEKNGRFYNLNRNEGNRHLTLDPGENNLKIYGQAYDVRVMWQDEVI